MEKPAIIFTHKGNPRYLKHALNNARKSNPNSRVILLGDDTNKKINKNEHFYIKDYFFSAKDFEKKYIYQSSNKYEFELFCFQRWFVLKDFVTVNDIEHFIACDSDVLIYEDLSQYFDYSQWKKDYLNVVDRNGPQCVYFTKESITNFCDYILKQYTDSNCLDRLAKRWEQFVSNKLPGGNCDMTMFTFYQEDFPNKLLNLYGITHMQNNNMFFYDASNYESDNIKVFIHKKERDLFIAKMIFKRKTPYILCMDGNKYKSPVIHFQGPYKRLMCEYSYSAFYEKFFDLIKYSVNNFRRKLSNLRNKLKPNFN